MFNAISNQQLREAYQYEEADQWHRLISHCLRLFKYMPDDLEVLLSYTSDELEVLKMLALGYFNIGDAVNVEKYCNIALSSLPTDSVERVPFERLLEKVTSNRNIPEYAPSSGESEWTALINPDIEIGQTWIGQDDIDRIESRLSVQNMDLDFNVINEIRLNCWQEIKFNRSYEVPSRGRIEILLPEIVSRLLDLQTVRFIQEGTIAPAVYVRFEYANSKIGVLKINSEGYTIGFHEGTVIFKAFLDTVALTYYRDLVVPDYRYVQDISMRRNIRRNISRDNQEYISKKSSTRKNARSLPRRNHPLTNVYSFQEWHLAQHRARHSVVGHIRWVRDDFVADWEKDEQARRAGIELPLGYTFVIEHERGGREGIYLVLNGTDLSERTRFAPPSRAVDDLNRLLSGDQI